MAIVKTSGEPDPTPGKTRQRWFMALARVSLAVSVPTYLIALFVNRELNFIASLQVPVLSASVLVLLGVVERIESSLNDEGDRVLVRVYPTHGEFYRDLGRCVDNAERTVFTSYLRRYAPSSLGESAMAYFHACNAWAERSRDHHFRRVIASAGAAGDMGDWTRSQAQHSREMTDRGVNHRVRVLPWDLREADAISIAIIDEDWVFVTFSGEEDHLSGFSLRSRCLVKDYFLPYYRRLWEASVPQFAPPEEASPAAVGAEAIAG